MRYVCNFSCGAASAVATSLTLQKYRHTEEVEVVNAFVAEEHPDNRRFLADCEKWFGKEITVLAEEKHGASAYEVFTKRRFLKNRNGAACSKLLKKELLDSFSKPGDVTVVGYTAEEEARFDRFLDANNIECEAPLIEAGLGKKDCLAILSSIGIELPEMYKLGYKNANCIGCVKGGQGYWNKIRRDFPETFEKMCQVEELIGPTSYLFRDRKTNIRYPLRDLDPNSGRYQDEPDIACSFHCEAAVEIFKIPTW